jgi:hypothetical protein
MNAFKRASIFCKNTHFLLRINDGVIAITPIVVRFFKEKVNQAKAEGNEFKNAIIGHLVNKQMVPRKEGSKFYVSHEDYSEKYYMPFIAGEFYFVTSDLAAKYLNLSQYVHRPPFSVWIEDSFLTMLSLHLGVDFVRLNGLFHHYHPAGNSIISRRKGSFFVP